MDGTSTQKRDFEIVIDKDLKLEYNYDRHKVLVIYENNIVKVYQIDDYDVSNFFKTLDEFIDSLRSNHKKRSEFMKELKDRYDK